MLQTDACQVSQSHTAAPNETKTTQNVVYYENIFRLMLRPPRHFSKRSRRIKEKEPFAEMSQQGTLSSKETPQRKAAPRFTEDEKSVLIDLVRQFRHIIEWEKN